MKARKESFFWTSYSDLMTSLFLVMLVLFVFVIVILKRNFSQTEVELEEIKKWKEQVTRISNSTEDLQKDSRLFGYMPDYKKFKLNVEVVFGRNIDDIWTLPPATIDDLRNAGHKIREFLLDEAHRDYQYLLIVEGQASKDSTSQRT